MHTARRRLAGEVVFSIVLVAFAAFMLWTAYGISGFESLTSAGAFPMVATAVMLLTAIANVVHAWREQPSPRTGGESALRQFVRQLTPGVLVAFTLAIALYMLLLESLGFVIASYLFLVLSMRLLGSRRIGLNLIVAALSLAAVYLVFQTVFSVVLPSGTLLKVLSS